MRRRASLLFAIFLVFAALGLRWTRLPRPVWNLDEGSTFTMAQQVLAGDVLYRDAADNRSPLVPYLKAAVFAVAGDWNAYAVHLVLAIALGGCAVALWRIARRLGDEPAGIAAALVFTALSLAFLDPPDAISANTGWCLAAFSTFGMAAFAWGLTAPRFSLGLLAGVMFGGSFLCKQPGLFDLLAALVVLGLKWLEEPAARRPRQRFAAGVLVGAAAPVAGFAAHFAAHGALADAIYYAYTFNTRLYIPEVPLGARLAGMRMPFLLAAEHAPAALGLGIGGAIVAIVFVTRRALRRPFTIPVLPWLILGWAAAGILATGLSGRMFSHYSAQVVPALSLACGWMIARAWAWSRAPERKTGWRTMVAIGTAAVAVALAFDVHRQLRRLSPSADGPLVAARTIAEFTRPPDRIFVWGYDPELYFFAHRLPASRFLYANYVTGMIAWTNLDPLVDTTYAVPAEAWPQLTGDLEQHPPAAIIDTGGLRGYLKYPLHDQGPLWSRIRTGFAQVAVNVMAGRGYRLFRRLDAPAPAVLPPGAPDPRLSVTGVYEWRHNEPPRLRVRAAPGATRVELFAGERCLAALPHPADEPVDVIFFVPETAADRRAMRAVVTRATGRTASAPFDFEWYSQTQRYRGVPGPTLEMAGLAVSPVAIDVTFGEPHVSEAYPGEWRVDAPERFEYRLPPGVIAVDFTHGLYDQALHGSNGYDVLVDFIDDRGQRTRLHQRRLVPRLAAKDQGPQAVKVAIPGAGPGRLIVQFLAGPENQPDYDWIHFGRLQAETGGPAVLMDDAVVLPGRVRTENGSRLRDAGPHRWLAHAPTTVEWPRPDNLAAVTLTFGMEPGSYTALNGHSDGIDVSLELVEPSGKSHALYAQAVMPFNHPEHRGPQTARVALPPGIAGRLVFRVGPGPRGDTSWDWGWLDDLRGEAYGPSIELGGNRAIPPRTSHVVDAQGGPSTRNDDSHWGAHADAELVYDRPAALRRVTFRYGLAEGADRDPSGKQRSDGVDVIVELHVGGQPVRELFRRNLDPFHRAADLGEQTSTVDLPPMLPGELVFRLTPGPSGSNAFDWGFWGRFTGELEP